MNRKTLADRLAYLLAEFRKVAESGVVTPLLAQVAAQHLERAVAEAAVLVAEVEILRAQAADRERARGALQQMDRDLTAIAAAAPGQSAQWAVGRMRAALNRVAA
jgi:hypothetical protein